LSTTFQSSIKQPTQNLGATLGHLNWIVFFLSPPILDPKIFMKRIVFCQQKAFAMYELYILYLKCYETCDFMYEKVMEMKLFILLIIKKFES